MNSHTLKINGSSELPEALEIDQTYKVVIEADITDIRKKTNHDGGYTYVYSAEQTTAEVIDKLGQVIKTKDKKKQSKKLRDQIYFIRLDYAPDHDEDAFYERAMGAVRHRLVDILREEGII